MWIAIGIVAAVVLFVLIFSLVTYFIVFYSPYKGQDDPNNLPNDEQYLHQMDLIKSLLDGFSQRSYQTVEATSFDGLKLFGRYYHIADGAPLALCFHGYRGNPTRDFCGGGTLLAESGYNVLVVEQRAHGRSKGHTITFGIKERYDCLTWIRYAVERFGPDVKIVLYGVSMGAATVVMASNLDLPSNVLGIVTDCPYSSPKEIICKVCLDKRLSSKLVYPFIWLGARLFGHFNPSKGSAVQCVAQSKVPILLIHGEDDRFVPCQMSQKIFEANPQMVHFETFPNAPHATSCLEDFPRYTALLREFWKGLFEE